MCVCSCVYISVLGGDTDQKIYLNVVFDYFYLNIISFLNFCPLPFFPWLKFKQAQTTF